MGITNELQLNDFYTKSKDEYMRDLSINEGSMIGKPDTFTAPTPPKQM